MEKAIKVKNGITIKRESYGSNILQLVQQFSYAL